MNLNTVALLYFSFFHFHMVIGSANEKKKRVRRNNLKEVSVGGDKEEDTNKPFGRSLKGGRGICGECEYETYFHFRSARSPFNTAITSGPSGCVLASIRDERSRRGAQYAIPPGEIAITQGYFAIDDYIEDCNFNNAKTEDGTVNGCNVNYFEYFENYDETDVVSEPSSWVDLTFPIPDGALYAAIGADGKLRPVIQWSTDVDEFGYTGAVYECCPRLVSQICSVARAS